MLIEKDARRHVLQAINCDKEMKLMETKERLKGRVLLRTPQYDILRKEFVDICNQINSVANTQGKGRDDFKIDILLVAEDTSRKITGYKSKAIRKLSEQIKTSFNNLRLLFRKYSENIEAVDPQLKNNTDLADALLAFEKSWERGKDFLLIKEKKETLLSMSELIEGLVEKHKEISEKMEAMDADIFIILPCLSILKAIEERDTKILSYYKKDNILFKEIERCYKKMKLKINGFELYNILENLILEKSIPEHELSEIKLEDMKKLVHNMKQLAIIIQRSNPTNWNSLMETSMGII